jgi:hypothetical protein
MVGLLLDEHLSPKIAAGLRRLNLRIPVHSINEWKGGAFRGRADAECLAEAARNRLTLVTYDCRTIPALLRAWREQGRGHAGIIYVDQRTISSCDIGSLVRALAWVVREFGGDDWTDREEFLRYV